jgi:hypothetical protein
MHESDTTATSPAQGTLKEEALATIPQVEKKQARSASATASKAKPLGLMARCWRFAKGLFTVKPKAQPIPVVAAPDLTVADRAAVARSAQMPPPVAFKGDTASTLVTPMGAYAGKPVDLAIRKRAEQQFKNMDLSQTTMN